jgi:hypothetical protein
MSGRSTSTGVEHGRRTILLRAHPARGRRYGRILHRVRDDAFAAAASPRATTRVRFARRAPGVETGSLESKWVAARPANRYQSQ